MILQGGEQLKMNFLVEAEVIKTELTKKEVGDKNTVLQGFVGTEIII